MLALQLKNTSWLEGSAVETNDTRIQAPLWVKVQIRLLYERLKMQKLKNHRILQTEPIISLTI